MAIRQITFNYNANGGAGAPSSSTDSFNVNSVPFTKTKQISSTKPSRTYYNFLGWSAYSGATSATWASSQTLSFTWASLEQLNVTMNFYAVWQHQTAYVKYNANGGTGAPETQSHWAGYSVTLSATIPTRSKYVFVGWATSSTATAKQYDAGQSNVPLYVTTTLYAVWKKASDKVSSPNGTLGSALTLTISKVDNSYTDDITYTFGSVTGTIATGTSASSITWTPPISLANEIPNASSAICTFTCKTYNGSEFIGQTTTAITLTVPQTLAPTVSVSYADTNATASSWGLFVQSRSKVAFTITAAGQESATVSSYSTSVNGTSYTTDSFTTGELINSGTNTYTVVVTDSRGLQTTVTGTYSVEPYGNPSLTLISCDRDDSDDAQINVEFNFTVSSVSNYNDANYALDYKLKSASTWTQGTVKSLGGYSGTITDYISNLDGGDEWNIRIRVIDSFATATALSEIGVSGNILLNSRHLGGLGLLMKSQANNQMDVGKPTVFHGRNLEQFGSTVATHSTSGNYAKILTFGSNVTTGKNLAPTNSYNTSRVYWGTNINSANILGQVLQTLPAGTYTLSWKHTMTAVANATFQTGSYIRYNDGSWHILASYSVTTQVSCAVGDEFTISRTITIGESDVGQNFEVLAYCGQDSGFKSTISEYQIEVGSQKTPFEPYVDITNMDVSAPVTMEYIRSSDETKTELTIVFNPDYSLSSFNSNNSADAYLHRSSASVWNLYIGKNSSSDSVEILDFHNPWSNTDMTVDWEDTSVSTLPTGYISASKINGMMQCGVKTGSTVAANSYGDFTVTFPAPFPSVPTVVVSLYTSSTGYGMGSVTAVVCQGTITTTGFTIRCYNNDTVGRNPAYTWIAML